MSPHEESLPAEELLAEAGFLRRLARGLVGDEHDAADLAQETMLVALGHPPRPVGPLRAWLATVAANLARNVGRGEGARARREQAAARPERIEAEDELGKLETQRALFDLVLALPEEQRTVLYLRYYADLGPSAIAARLGVPVKTVKSRHTRALAALRERLDARSAGDRRSWMEALALLAVPRAVPWTGGAIRSAIGGIAVKKVVLAGVAVVLALIGWRALAHGWLGERWEASRDGGEHVTFRPLETKPAELAPALAPQVLEQRQPLVEAVPATTGALRLGFRHSDGTPANDLPFAVECRNDPAPRVETFRARTGGDGSASVGALFAGPAWIWLDTVRFEAEVEAGTTRSYAFTLPEGSTVEGSVVDPDGAPVAQAEIWAGDSSARFPGGMLLALSAGDGSFRARDVADVFSAVGARKRGYLPSQCWNPLEMSAVASGVRTVRLVLGARGGSVRGRVLDPDGKPLARASVLAGPDGGWTSSAQPGTAPEPAFAETDENGAFELGSDLPPGKHPIHATARGFPVWRGEVEVVAGQTSAIEIRLERPARIEGRLLGLDGESAGGVQVLAAEEDRGGWYHDRFGPSETVSDDEGWFVLDWVAPGLREVNAHDDRRPELGRARASVPCTAGETATCELRLELGLTIAGTVVDESGAPIAGWNVESQTRMFQWYPRRARTDPLGRFLLANLGDSAHDLIVRSPEADEHVRARLDGVPTGTQDALLVVADAHAAKGTLRGRFVAPPGERPESFVLTLWMEGGDEGLFLEPDAAGAFETQVLPGRYQVRVGGGGEDLLVSATFEVEPDGDTDVGELRLEEPGRVEITLTGFPPEALERLRLSLDHEGCSTVKMEREDGVLRSPEIMPGRWTVSLNSSDLGLQPSEVEVRPGTTTPVELRLEPTVRVRLAFTNPARDEVEVEALGPGGRRLFQRTYLAPEETPVERTLSIGLLPGRATIRLRTHAGLKGEVELDVSPALASAPPIAVELR